MRMARERFQRPAGPRQRHVAHAPAGLVAEAVHDHLVVGKERAVEEEGVRGGDALVQIIGHAGAARRIDQLSPAASTATPTVPSPIASVVTSPSSSQSGTFPGTGKSSSVRPGKRLEDFAERDRLARDDVAADDVENAVRADRVEGRARAKNRERLALAQRQEPGGVIDIGVGQAARRRSANGGLRLSAGAPASPKSAGAGRSRR